VLDRELYGDNSDKAFVRPPEEVYQPAGIETKLTEKPRKPLLAMHNGATLYESAWRWTAWPTNSGLSTSKTHRTRHQRLA
jgi:hypothetical protein